MLSKNKSIISLMLALLMIFSSLIIPSGEAFAKPQYTPAPADGVIDWLSVPVQYERTWDHTKRWDGGGAAYYRANVNDKGNKAGVGMTAAGAYLFCIEPSIWSSSRESFGDNTLEYKQYGLYTGKNADLIKYAFAMAHNTNLATGELDDGATYGQSMALLNMIIWNLLGRATPTAPDYKAAVAARVAEIKDYAATGKNAAKFEGDVNVYMYSAGGKPSVSPYQVLIGHEFTPQNDEVEIQVQKKSTKPEITDGNAKYNMSGIQYKITTQFGQTLGTVTLDSKGNSNKINIDGSQASDLIGTTIYAQEVKSSVAGTGYVYSNKRISAVVKNKEDGTTIFNASNEPESTDPAGEIELTKIDDHTASTRGNASLAGAKFEVKHTTGGKTYTAIYKTDSEGKLKIADKSYLASGSLPEFNGNIELVAGDLTIKEVEASEGYQVSNQVIKFEIKNDGEGLRIVNVSDDERSKDTKDGIIYYETIKRGGVQIKKYLTEEEKTKTSHGNLEDLSGIRFAIVNRSKAKVNVKDTEYEPGTIVAIQTTDKDGNASYEDKDLPYGAYSIHELREDYNPNVGDKYTTGGKSQFARADKQLLWKENRVDFNITDHDTVVRTGLGTQKNDIVKGSLKLQKSDSDGILNQGDASIEGVTYALINRSKHRVLFNDNYFEPGTVMDLIKVNNKGQAERQNLVYGTYDIVELRKDHTAKVGTKFEESQIGKSELANDSGYLYKAYKETLVMDRHEKVLNYKNDDAVLRGSLSLQKADIETGKQAGQDMLRLDGIKYAVVNRSKNTVLFEGEQYKPGQVIKLVVTDAAGNTPEITGLAYGTYELRELREDATIKVGEDFNSSENLGTSKHANKYYAFRDNTTKHEVAEQTVEIRENGQKSLKNLFNNFPIRGDLELNKVLENKEAMPYTPFLLSRLNAEGEKVESHVIITDKDGKINTKDRVYENVNSLDEFVQDGKYTGELNDEAAKVNVFFGAEEGLKHNSRPLLYGAYMLEELQTPNNYRYDMVTHYIKSVEDWAMNQVEEKEDVLNLFIDMKSDAFVNATDSKVVAREKDLELQDTVSIFNLHGYNKYKLQTKAVHVKKDGTQEVIGESAVYEFLPNNVDGQTPTGQKIETKLTVDASDLEPGSYIAMTNYLYYTNKEGKDIQVQDHNLDTLDENQKLYAPEIGTKAHDINDRKEIDTHAKATIIDTVKYSNLQPGKEYTTKGVLMDKETNEPIKHENGKEVTNEVTFTPEEASGTIDVVFEFNAKLVEDKTLVAFETLERNGREVAIHHDIEDEDQTIKVNKPRVKTTLLEEETGEKFVKSSKVKLVDIVEYKDLIIGKEYTMKGKLVVKDTEEVIATNEVKFIPEEKDGKLEVPFEVDLKGLGGREIVAGEELWSEDQEVHTHYDLEDKDQTIEAYLILKVKVAKADSKNVKHFLKGAEITIFDQDGKVVKDIHGKDAIGTTDENGLVEFEIYYEVGQTLYAKETKAPKGYHINPNKFEVKLTGEDELGVDLIAIDILDDAIVIPPTNVNSNVVLFSAVGLVSLVGIYFTIKSLRRKEEETIEG